MSAQPDSESENIQPRTAPGDGLLEVLVDLLDAPKVKGTTFSVTVSLKGTVVTGTLCSYDEWVEVLGHQKVNGEGGQIVWDAMVEGLRGKRDKPRPDDEVARYFHMKEATILYGPSRHEVGTFRGVIGEVDGWSFGRLN